MERKIYLGILVLFSFFLMFSLRAHAESSGAYFVIAPNCLVKNLKSSFQVLSTFKPNSSSAKEQEQFLFIQTNMQGIQQLIQLKQLQAKVCGGFIDVSEDWNHFSRKQGVSITSSKNFLNHYILQGLAFQKTGKSFPDPQHEKEVNQLLTQMNPQNMWNNLAILSNYRDRYANSDSGVQVAQSIKAQVETIAANQHRDDVTVYLVPTGRYYKQPSVVAKVGNSNEPGVVIGAHLDTLNSNFSKKPGADDDGSGSVTVLEAAKTILESGLRFKKPLYFIWYAAEEEGLVGSGYVVADFKRKNIPVDAVLNFDMTGFAYQNDPAIWLITDNVSKDLNQFLVKLINAYVKQPIKYTRCGYACSDHASWTQSGYAAAIPAEAAFEHTNPSMHTSGDTMEKLSLDHMKDYLKIALSFAAELAEPA